jgi:hypothetical protein
MHGLKFFAGVFAEDRYLPGLVSDIDYLNGSVRGAANDTKRIYIYAVWSV